MYYTAWSLTDAAVIAHGLGFNGTDKGGSYLWDRVISIYVVELETAATPVKSMAYWNHMISVWLNKYVTQRLITKGEKAGPMVTAGTFMISAFWHGFYPFYYFMFIMCGFYVELCKDVYRMRILFDFIPAPFGHILATISVHFFLNYLGVSFDALTFERGMNFGQATNYLVYIAIPTLCIGLKLSGLI